MNPTESAESIINVQGVSKVFKLYQRQLERIKEVACLPFGGKKYHRPFVALDEVSLSIGRGDTIGIIGKNGSGKSTLLQIICGILQPTSGSVHVTGRVSALLELGAGFNPEFSGRENVYLNGSILGMSREEMDNCFDDIAAFADIGDFIDQPVKNYSSGMYVRLAFAVAINVNPDILIVDEALSVGDISFQAKCFEKFREFQEQGVTILFVTHSMNLVTRYCNNAYLLDHGKIIQSGAAKDVVDTYNRLSAGTSPIKDNSNGASPDEMLVRHLRNSESKYRTNPNENRYGNGKVEIIEVGIRDINGKESNTLIHGEKYVFWFKALFHETIEHPITAYTVKDVKGFDLCASNTHFQNLQIGLTQEGEILLTTFEHRMMLNPGGYLLSFGCAGFKEQKYVVYDRRYDVLTFEVVSDRGSTGVFDLDSKITVTRS